MKHHWWYCVKCRGDVYGSKWYRAYYVGQQSTKETTAETGGGLGKCAQEFWEGSNLMPKIASLSIEFPYFLSL